jgi:hypothetical protein
MQLANISNIISHITELTLFKLTLHSVTRDIIHSLISFEYFPFSNVTIWSLSSNIFNCSSSDILMLCSEISFFSSWIEKQETYEKIVENLDSSEEKVNVLKLEKHKLQKRLCGLRINSNKRKHCVYCTSTAYFLRLRA